MSIFTLSSVSSADNFVDWDNSSLWAQGTVPDTSDAQVFFNDVGQNYFVQIGQSDSFSIGSFNLAANNLLLYGSLQSAGSLTIGSDAGIQIYGGRLSAQSLHVNGNGATTTGLFGVGEIDVAGPVYNGSTIIGGDATGLSDQTTLTLKAAYLSNSGLLEAAVGATFVVETATASGFTNYGFGVLTGGSYMAQSNATLDLKTSGLVFNDAATLILDGAGTDIIASYDPSTDRYVPIQQTLTLITPSGTLELDAASYSTAGQLSVAGSLKLIGLADFTAASLYVTPGGKVSLMGAIPETTTSLSATRIIDDGQILIGANSGGEGKISGSVTGAGMILLAPEFVTVNRFGQTEITTANAELAGSVSVNLAYSDGTGTFILDNPGSVTGRFQHFTAGDEIVLGSVMQSAVTGLSYAGSASSGVLTIQENGTALHLAFSGQYMTDNFVLGTDANTGWVSIVGVTPVSPAVVHAA